MKNKRPRVVLVNRALVLKNNKILLVQRSKDDSHNSQKWELPGGKLDKGQDISNALEREVLEETGLAVIPINRIVYYSSYIISKGEYENLPYISLVGIVKSLGGTVTLSEEHDAYKWLSIEESLKMDLSHETRKALTVLGEDLEKYM